MDNNQLEDLIDKSYNNGIDVSVFCHGIVDRTRQITFLRNDLRATRALQNNLNAKINDSLINKKSYNLLLTTIGLTTLGLILTMIQIFQTYCSSE
jgi:hypothetical protein